MAANVIIKDFEDVQFLRRNFRGEAEKFNDEGDRYIAILIPEDKVEDLRSQGFNVSIWNRKAEPEDRIHCLRIKIGFDRFPPQIVVFKGGKKVRLGENECQMLDWADIVKCDLTVRARVWDEATGRRSCWLKSLFVGIAESELEARYSQVPFDDAT